MPFWVQLGVTILGVLFFAAYLAATLYNLKFKRTRDERLEAAGAVIPGISGLILASMVWFPPGFGWAVISVIILAAFLVIGGRALYEGIVFRRRRRGG